MARVLGIGDNVCDVYLHKKWMYPGGQALNFAVYAKMLGAESAYLGVFGQDAIANHIQDTLNQKGVDWSRCRHYSGENGFARVTIVDGDRVFMGSNKGGVLQGHFLELLEEDLAYIKQFSIVHTTNNAFFDAQLPKLKDLGPLVSYDFSIRWNEEDRIKRVCPYIDFAFLSCSDLSEKSVKDLCLKLHYEGCGVITATRGSRGTIVYDGTRFYVQEPLIVKPIDTMGAGDSFATCILVKIAEALEKDGIDKWHSSLYRAAVLPDALQAAAAFASKTCLVEGAFGCGIPVPDSIKTRVTGEL